VLSIRSDTRSLRVIAEQYAMSYKYIGSVRRGAVRKDAI
jgi:hypothetical protein